MTTTKGDRLGFFRRAAAALFCGGLAACAPARVPTPRNSTAAGGRPAEVRLDPALQGLLEVGPVARTRLPSGALRLSIPLRNRGPGRLELLVKVVFRDASGFAIPGDETPRVYLAVPPGSVRHTATSFRPEAQRFTIEIDRYAR